MSRATEGDGTRNMGAPNDTVEISLYTIAAMIVRKVRVGMAVGILVVLVSLPLVIGALTVDRTWTATGSFMPERNSGAMPMGLEALTRLGFGLQLGSGAGSLQYYEDLLRTRSLLDLVTAGRYPMETDDGTRLVSLAEVAGYDGDHQEAAASAAAGWLRGAMRVSVAPASGVLRFEVTAPDPHMAKAVADSVIAAVHAHNLERRQTEAGGERRFIEGRLADVRGELEAHEGNIAAFLRENRQFETSPDLRLRYERLMREIRTREQVMITLVQAFEQARIAELRNTATISVVETPRVPLHPDGRRGPLMWGVWISILAGMAALAAAFIAALVDQARTVRSPNYQDLEDALSELRAQMVRRREPV
jgi:hypothetical protein